jgi:CheY-like chemotaxis protein
MNVKAVLVIDDDKRTRETLRMLLDLEGYVVDFCESGPPAFERLKEMSFELILIDYRLPHSDGTEVVRSVRELYPDAFIVGMGIENKKSEFMVAGANAFINKARLAQSLLLVTRRKLRQ